MMEIDELREGNKELQLTIKQMEL